MAKETVLIQRIHKGRKEVLQYDAKDFEKRKELLSKDGYSKIMDQAADQKKPEPAKEKESKKKEADSEVIGDIAKALFGKQETSKKEDIPETNNTQENI